VVVNPVYFIAFGRRYRIHVSPKRSPELLP